MRFLALYVTQRWMFPYEFPIAAVKRMMQMKYLGSVFVTSHYSRVNADKEVVIPEACLLGIYV